MVSDKGTLVVSSVIRGYHVRMYIAPIGSLSYLEVEFAVHTYCMNEVQ